MANQIEIYQFPDLASAERGIKKAVHSLESNIVFPGKHTDVEFHPVGSKLFDETIRLALRSCGGILQEA